MPRKIVTYPTSAHTFLPSSVIDRSASAVAYNNNTVSTKTKSSNIYRSLSDSYKRVYDVTPGVVPVESQSTSSTPTAGRKNKGVIINNQLASSISTPQLHVVSSSSGSDLSEIETATAKIKLVTRRNKHQTAATLDNKQRRRRGVYISAPVVDENNAGAVRNGASSLAEQEKLLQQLITNSPAKPSSTSPPSGVVRKGMADRIQRTIKALYEGGGGRYNSKKSGHHRSGTDSTTSSSKPRRKEKHMLLNNDQYTIHEEEDSNGPDGEVAGNSSPKPEKRNLPKKRSPKPTRHNLHAPPNKDVDGSKRFKWRGSVNKIARKFGQGNARMCGHAFGSHLEDCPSSPNNELIPFVVELCCRLVEERGLWAKGIYRVPGNTGTCNTLIEDLNQKGPDGIDVEVDTRFKEVNVISSLLKNYFRTLPDPLFTNELYKNFITTNRKPDTDDRLKGLRRLVHMLPGPHYETLKYLIQHLRRVADNAEENKMDVRNLAIVFGPTLVRTTATDNMTSMVTDMSDQCRIVESILQNVEWFFTESAIGGEDGDGGDGDRIEPVPVPTDTSQEQIIPSINHLLVNVGRTAGNKETTTGDSDSASESSKSKHSTTSEKESFSRDVINTLFGKRWKNVMMTSSSTGGGGSKKEEGEADNSSKDGDDDEFGFKQLEKRRMKKSEQQQQQQQDSNKQQQQQETGEGEAVQSSATSSPATGANSARAYRRHLSQPDDVPSTSHRHHHYSTDSVPLPQTPPISSTHKHKFHPAPPPLPINNQNRVGGGAGPGDYSSRFVVFCNEQLERFDHQQQQRHNYHPHHQPQHQIISSSSSSTTEKSSPLLPPRHYHQPHQSSHTPSTPRRQFTAAASSKPPPPPPASSSSSRTNFHYNQQTYMYGDAPQNRRFSKDPRYEHNMVPFVLVPSSSSNNQQAHQSSTIQQPASSKPQQPSTTTDNHHSDEPTPNTSVLGNGESDSETSLSMGETIEEKLKNLTNLDKKFERRPSRRLRDTSDFLTPVFTKSSATAKPKLKKLSAQSQQQLAASVSNHPQQQQQHDSKKTTLDLYQERKEMRKLQRDLVKASRSGANMARKHPLGGGSNHHRNSMIRCASEENVFNDVTRTQEAVPLPSRKSSKIRRRHTLGGSDVMDDDDNDDVGVTVTIQPPTAPNTTEMKRRRPSVTSSSSGASFRGGRKTESYL